MSFANLPQSLDVILVRGTSAKSTWLCGLQSIAMLQSVSFSHAAVSIGDGICLHAMPKGVALIRTSALWNSRDYRAEKIVLRSKKIATPIETDELLRQTHQFTREVFGTRYNFFFGIPKQWIGANAWFCSELAAAALKKVGHDVVPTRKPETVWPGHFQRCRVLSDEWEDVTAVYEAYIAEVTKGSDESCSNVFARTRYLTGEAEFGLYDRAYKLMFDGDRFLEDAEKFDAKLRALKRSIKSMNETKRHGN
jgi:hypothetical protein